jgi:hypothetical protein
MPGPYGAKGTFDDWQLCEWVNLGRAVEAFRRVRHHPRTPHWWGLPLDEMSRAPMVRAHIVPDENHALLLAAIPERARHRSFARSVE